MRHRGIAVTETHFRCAMENSDADRHARALTCRPHHLASTRLCFR
jgi:hypothetical protein